MKPLLIDGVWTTTPDGYENINPSDTSDIIDVYAQAGRAETQTAIGAAQAAFGEWEFSARSGATTSLRQSATRFLPERTRSATS